MWLSGQEMNSTKLASESSGQLLAWFFCFILESLTLGKWQLSRKHNKRYNMQGQCVLTYSKLFIWFQSFYSNLKTKHEAATYKL